MCQLGHLMLLIHSLKFAHHKCKERNWVYATSLLSTRTHVPYGIMQC